MTNELLYALRDKGYPQTVKRGFLTGEHADYVYSPTLTELIEACGDDLSHLKQIVGAPEGGKWWAVTHSKFDANNNYEECGATPEEAVARLWLSLQTSPEAL